MTRLLTKIGVLILFLVIITATYMPLVQTHFFYQDDYIWLLPNASQSELINLGLSTIGTGRFLDGYSQYKVYEYLHYLQSVGADSAIRFVGIISIALLAYVLFITFKTNRIKTKYAFIASILICTLPSFQVYASWIVINPEINAATLSALAGLLLFKVVFKENRERLLHRIVAIFIAVLLLVNSMQLYQPAAMFYWSVGLIPLALLRDEDLKKKWRTPFIVYFSVGFVSMSIYFFSIKIVNYVMGTHTMARGALIPFTVESIKWKIKWFLTSPLKNSLNLWNISPSYILGGFVGILILAGFILGLRQSVLQAIKQRRFNLIWSHSQRMLLIISIMPLSLLPTLLIRESWATYRTIISLEASICILLFISLLHIEEFLQSITMLSDNFKKMIIPVILVILTIFVVYDAHGNVKKYFAELQSFELQYIRNTIKEYGISKLTETSRIYVREPEKSYYLDNRWRFEFGRPSTNDGFGSYMVRVALYELGIKKKIKIIEVRANEPLPEDNDILIIDINKLNVILDKRFSNNSDNVSEP